MANLAQKKTDSVNAFVKLVPSMILLAGQISELNKFLTDNGFLTGGANAIVDADFSGFNGHLDAATFNAAVTAMTTMTLSVPNATALRKASITPIPGVH